MPPSSGSQVCLNRVPVGLAGISGLAQARTKLFVVSSVRSLKQPLGVPVHLGGELIRWDYLLGVASGDRRAACLTPVRGPSVLQIVEIRDAKECQDRDDRHDDPQPRRKFLRLRTLGHPYAPPRAGGLPPATRAYGRAGRTMGRLATFHQAPTRGPGPTAENR